MRIAFVAILFGLFLTNYSVAQHGMSHDIVNYTPKEYRRHYQNWKTVQDDRGVLFFANGDGVLQYDGTYWDHTLTATRTNVLSLNIDSGGRIYFGGIGEIGYLVPGENGRYKAVQLVSEKYGEELSSEFMWETHVFHDTIVYRSPGYFTIIQNDSIVVEKAKFGINSNSYKANGKIWYQGEQNKMHWFNPSKPSIHHNLNQVLIDSNFIVGVYEYKSDLIFVSNKADVFLFNPKTKETKCIIEGRKEEEFVLKSSSILADGNLVMSTKNEGVYVVNMAGEIVNHYHVSNGLKTDRIVSVFQDREGILWLNSGEGISKVLYNIPYTILKKENSNLKGVTNSILNHIDKLYVGTSEGVFVSFNNEIYKVEGIDSQVFDVELVGDEVIAAASNGIYSIDNFKAKIIAREYGRAITSFDKSGSKMVVGGKSNVFFFEKNNYGWEFTHSINDFPDEVLHIEMDQIVNNEFVIWAGLYSIGAARITCTHDFKNVKYDILGKDNGVNEGYILPFRARNKLYYVPKEPGGVYNFDRKSNQFLPDDLITPRFGKETSSWLIKEDSKGNIYFENSGPLYLLRPKGDDYEIDSLAFSTLNVDYVNDIHVDSNDICWIAGGDALARFNPNYNSKADINYQMKLKSVKINRDSILFTRNFFKNGNASLIQQGDIPVLDYSLNNLSFEFSAVYFNGSIHTNYSYQLQGFDSEYSSWSKENKAVYTNLPEGNYVFTAKASNIYGLESETLNYEFSILPPWYRTRWAYIGYAVLGLLTLVLGGFLISLRLRRANEKLAKLVDEKTSEIVLQRDELSFQKEKLVERNKEITDSINYAKRIQSAILPPDKLVKEYLSDSFILYKPKDIVAGDFYWMEHRDGKILFAAADCTGHGVPGAMVSVICNNGLNRSVREYGLTDPGQILDKTREIVIQEFEKSEDEVKDGMDIALCSIEGNVLQYAGANNPLWIIRNGELLETKADKQPIGKYLNLNPFTTHTVQLQKGDSIYIFSDGYVDQFGGEKGKKLKSKAFRELLLSIQDKPMESQKTILDEAFETWRGDLEQIDDVCVIGVKI